MAKLTDEARARLENLTVTLLLELRREYLGTPGCSVLKHWDQLQSRLVAAARTTENVPEWLSAMCRSLQLGAPRSSTCSAAAAVQRAAAEVGPAAWLDLLEREHAYLLAQARLQAEKRKAQADYYPDDSDHPGVEAEGEV